MNIILKKNCKEKIKKENVIMRLVVDIGCKSKLFSNTDFHDFVVVVFPFKFSSNLNAEKY